MERTKDKFMRTVQEPGYERCFKFWQNNVNPITMWVMSEPYSDEKIQARRNKQLDNN